MLPGKYVTARETDVQVLDDLRQALRQVRKVLDELARSDARNTAEIQALVRSLDRLEKHLDERHAGLIDWIKKLEGQALGNMQARWASSGAWSVAWRLLTAAGIIGGLVFGALKLL